MKWEQFWVWFPWMLEKVEGTCVCRQPMGKRALPQLQLPTAICALVEQCQIWSSSWEAVSDINLSLAYDAMWVCMYVCVCTSHSLAGLCSVCKRMSKQGDSCETVNFLVEWSHASCRFVLLKCQWSKHGANLRRVFIPADFPFVKRPWLSTWKPSGSLSLASTSSPQLTCWTFSPREPSRSR